MRYISWNTQGKNPTVYLASPQHKQLKSPSSLFSSTAIPDLICIQEAGVGDWKQTDSVQGVTWIPTSTSNTQRQYNRIIKYPLGTFSDYNGIEIPWQVSEDMENNKPATTQSNGRCSMLILWKVSLGDYDKVQVGGWWDGVNTHRPVFWVTISGIRIGCIHAPAGGNNGYINNAINAISDNGKIAEWVLLGDFNFSPDKLSGIQNLKTSRSNSWTQQSGGELDYAVYGGAKSNVCEAADQAFQSDHIQLRFDFQF